MLLSIFFLILNKFDIVSEAQTEMYSLYTSVWKLLNEAIYLVSRREPGSDLFFQITLWGKKNYFDFPSLLSLTDDRISQNTKARGRKFYYNLNKDTYSFLFKSSLHTCQGVRTQRWHRKRITEPARTQHFFPIATWVWQRELWKFWCCVAEHI